MDSCVLMDVLCEKCMIESALQPREACAAEQRPCTTIVGFSDKKRLCFTLAVQDPVPIDIVVMTVMIKELHIVRLIGGVSVQIRKNREARHHILLHRQCDYESVNTTLSVIPASYRTVVAWIHIVTRLNLYTSASAVAMLPR